MKRVKADRHQFELSAEAQGLLDRRDGRWEKVDLADGPAAQSMIDGVTGRTAPPPPPPADEEDVVDPDQIGLFDA